VWQDHTHVRMSCDVTSASTNYTALWQIQTLAQLNYRKNLEYNASLCLMRTSSLEFCCNATFYRPMYNTHPDLLTWHAFCPRKDGHYHDKHSCKWCKCPSLRVTRVYIICHNPLTADKTVHWPLVVLCCCFDSLIDSLVMNMKWQNNRSVFNAHPFS